MKKVFKKKISLLRYISMDETNWDVKRAEADGRLRAYNEFLSILGEDDE